MSFKHKCNNDAKRQPKNSIEKHVTVIQFTSE